MSDKFDDFLNRLELPLSEPVIVTIADKVMDVQVACVRHAGAFMQRTLCAVMSAHAPERKAVSSKILRVCTPSTRRIHRLL